MQLNAQASRMGAGWGRTMRRQAPQHAGVRALGRPHPAAPPAHGRLRGARVAAGGADATERLLPTVWCKGKQACWVAPEGGAGAARGVVLFLHGFAQGPEAYYQLMTEVAATAQVLVLAPCPPLKGQLKPQQEAFVEDFDFWLDLVAKNAVPDIKLPNEAAQKRGYLGHSLGGGLGAYLASRAAQDKRPFVAAMVLAPQTSDIVRATGFRAHAAIEAWPKGGGRTVWGLQYGLKDELAPPVQSLEVLFDLVKAQQEGKAVSVDTDFVVRHRDGTHTGFEDQVVAGDLEVVPDVLPLLNTVLFTILKWLIGGAAAPLYLAYRFAERLLTSKGKGAGEDADADAAAGGANWAAEGAAAGGGPEAPGAKGLLGGSSLVDLELSLLQRRRAEAADKLRAIAGTHPDGIGKPLSVDLPTPEQSAQNYASLLISVGAIGAALALPPFFAAGACLKDGCVPLLPTLGLGVLAVVEVQGLIQLRLLDYVEKVQRPHSRNAAAAFFKKHL